jgi:hypothetical protein
VAITFTGYDVSTTSTEATGKLLPGFFVSAPEERALRLIGGWLDESSRRAKAGETVSAELAAHFYTWLDDPRDRRAKQRALDIIMEGCLDGGIDDDCHDCHLDDDTHTIFIIHSY